MADDTLDPAAKPRKQKRSADATAKFLKTARDRFKQAQTVENDQRERELQDLRFYAGEQWPADVVASRAGQAATNGMPPVPARPCITINKTRQPVREVLNQERGSDIGIELVPADDFGDLTGPVDETEITLREGLTRRIQRESEAADARTWAFARATIAGRGYYVVRTRYVEGKTFDQEVYVQRLYNQACVSIDPAHEQPDGRDAEWEFIGTDMSWSQYQAEHGKRNGKKNKLCEGEMTEGEWRQLGDDQPEWFTGTGENKKIRVVEYFYVERKTKVLCTMPDGSLLWENELPDGVEPMDERTVIERSIKWAKIDGCDDDVLEETDWLGPDMPVVKVLGEELQPYDDKKRAEGMVRPMREPGQGNNVMVSKLVEMIGLTPMPGLMVEEGTIEGYEDWYIAANTRTLPYLPFKMTNLEGTKAVSPPFSVPREAPIGPVVQALAMFDDALQSTSQVSRPAMGETDSSVKSAKHANLLREQALQGTSNYMDNLMRSMRYEGQIINNLLYPIYGTRPGRIARIINGQGEPETLLIGQPMVQQGGKPMPAQPNDPNAKQYALTKDAKLNVGIKITKNFDFRREQEAAIAGEMIANSPGLLNVFGDLYFKNLDGPGHDEMADRMKVMLDPKVLQLIESKKQGQEPPSPALQAAQQQVQQLTQQLQQAGQMIQTEQVKEQAETQRATQKLQVDGQIAQLKIQADLEKAKMDNATKLQIEEYKLRGAQIQAEIDARERQLGAQTQAASDTAARAHEVGMAAMGNVHESGQAAEGRQHESQEAGAAREAQSVEAERARQAAAEQAALAAESEGV